MSLIHLIVRIWGDFNQTNYEDANFFDEISFFQYERLAIFDLKNDFCINMDSISVEIAQKRIASEISHWLSSRAEEKSIVKMKSLLHAMNSLVEERYRNKSVPNLEFQISDLISHISTMANSGPLPKSRASLLRIIEEILDLDFEVPLLSRLGAGRTQSYYLFPWVRILLRVSIAFEEDSKDRVLFEVMAETQIEGYLQGEREEVSTLKRPTYFFDLRQMVQPAFCTNEYLEITFVSDPFKDLFGVDPLESKMTLVDFFESQSMTLYDPLRKQDLGLDFSEMIRDSLEFGSDVDYMTVRWKSKVQNDKDVNAYDILDCFMSVQSRFPGIQGTFVVSTQKVNRYRSNVVEHLAFVESTIHNIKQPLAALDVEVENLKVFLNEKHPDLDLVRECASRVSELLTKSTNDSEEWLDHFRRNIERLDTTEGNLATTIGYAREKALSRYPRAKINIHTDNGPFERNDIVFLGSQSILESVLEGLFKNAIQHKTDGGQPKIDVYVKYFGANVHHQIDIMITDNAQGIDLKVLEAFNNHDIDDDKLTWLHICKAYVCSNLNGTIEINRGIDFGTNIRIGLNGKLQSHGE